VLISGTVNVLATKRLPNGKIESKYFKKRIKTAFVILAAAYLLLFPASSLKVLHQFDYNYWQTFFQANILHIIAVCLLILQVLYYFTRSNKGLAIASLVFAVFSLSIAWHSQMIPWEEILPIWLSPYISYKLGSIYTLFPVSSYFFFGVAIGAYLKELPKEKYNSALLIKSLVLGIIVFIGGYQLFSTLNELHYPYVNSQLINPGIVIFRTGAVLAFFPIIVLIHNRIKKYAKFYITLSRKSFFLFIIHLIIIYGCSVCPGLVNLFSQKLALPELLAAVLFVEVLSLLLAYYYDRSVKLIPYVQYAYVSVILVFVLMINVLF